MFTNHLGQKITMPRDPDRRIRKALVAWQQARDAYDRAYDRCSRWKRWMKRLACSKAYVHRSTCEDELYCARSRLANICTVSQLLVRVIE